MEENLFGRIMGSAIETEVLKVTNDSLERMAGIGMKYRVSPFSLMAALISNLAIAMAEIADKPIEEDD